jgi:hypothetical protein
MPITTTAPVTTEPQRRLRHRIADLASAVVKFARRSARQTRDSIGAGQRLDEINVQHPDFQQADIRQRVRNWVCFLALLAAISLDAAFSAPVAEHLLLTYLHATEAMATAGRFAVPALLIGIELAIGLGVRQAFRDGRWAYGVGWTLVGLLTVVVIPVLVGETEHTRAVLIDAQATGMAVSQSGLFDQHIPIFILAMMCLTFFVHFFVVFGPHDESVSYVTWSVQASYLQSGKTKGAERARRLANSAGDRFAEYAAARDDYTRSYPNSPLPTPNWSEAREVLKGVFGYEVISTPGAATTGAAAAGPQPDSPPAVEPQRPDAARTPPGEPTGDSGLDGILQQRIRDSDSTVSL